MSESKEVLKQDKTKQQNNRSLSKEHGSQLKELPMAKAGKI